MRMRSLLANTLRLHSEGSHLNLSTLTPLAVPSLRFRVRPATFSHFQMSSPLKLIDLGRDLVRSRRSATAHAARAEARQSTAENIALELLASEVKSLRDNQTAERDRCEERICAVEAKAAAAEARADAAEQRTAALAGELRALRRDIGI
jgi:hypothetical protein